MSRPLSWIYALAYLAIGYMIATLIVNADEAMGFPDAVRLGYSSCSTCHVSPSGGGVTKGYGRSAQEEQATWSFDGAGRLLGVVPDSQYVRAGGDLRFASVSYASDTTSEEINYELEHNVKSFAMQVEGELAVSPDGRTWAVGTLGHYGPEHERELRRSYVLTRVGPDSPKWEAYVRGGHFVPNFGINTPDHTAATRQGLGLGEGGERMTAEATLFTERVEVSVSETFDKEADLNFEADHGYSLYSGKPGWLARISGHALGSTIGVSGWRRPADNVLGLYGLIPLTRDGYLLAEYDRTVDRSDNEHRDLAWSELGFDVYRGVTVFTTAEYENAGRYGGGLRWIPVPHLELLGRVKWTPGLWSVAGVAHVWL